MRAVAILGLCQIAVPTKNLQFILGVKIIENKPLIEILAVDLAAVNATVVVDVIYGQKFLTVFATTSALAPQAVKNHLATLLGALFGIPSQVLLVFVVVCQAPFLGIGNQPFPVLLIMAAVANLNASLALGVINSASLLEIKVGKRLILVTPGTFLHNASRLAADCHALKHKPSSVSSAKVSSNSRDLLPSLATGWPTSLGHGLLQNFTRNLLRPQLNSKGVISFCSPPIANWQSLMRPLTIPDENRLYHTSGLRPARFGPLGPTPLRDSRYTFLLRGLARDCPVWSFPEFTQFS